MKMLRFDVAFPPCRFSSLLVEFLKYFSFPTGEFYFHFFFTSLANFLGFGPGFGHCPVFLFQVSQ
uniref:Uncharacterized protein n=1 Tax=Anguilla anguilla TaxID=7936 RepID=A0A0E9V9S8_ANGAN